MVDSDNVKLSQEILSLAPDAILFADREGIIRLWNKGAERIFGCLAEKAIGQSLDLIIPENMRSRHWDGYHKTMATGETRYGTDLLAVPAQRQDGSRISTEFSIVLVRNEGGGPFGVSAILRDVTPQWQGKKGLQDRIAELEAELKK